MLSKNTQNCFAYNSATKYRSEAVLYSKRIAGYPLSPYIKLRNKATKSCILSILKKTPNFGHMVHTLEIEKLFFITTD